MLIGRRGHEDFSRGVADEHLVPPLTAYGQATHPLRLPGHSNLVLPDPIPHVTVTRAPTWMWIN